MPGMTFEHGVILWKVIHLFVNTLAWPLTAIALTFLFRERLSSLLARIRSAKLPGGTELDFEKQAREVEQKALLLEQEEGGPKFQAGDDAGQRNKLNALLASNGLTPISSNFDLNHYYEVAQIDPKLALAAVRIDLEAMMDNLLRFYKVDRDRRIYSLSKKTDILLKSGYVTPSQYSIYRDILPLANEAVHGREPSLSSTNSVIAAFGALLDDFAAWVQQNLPQQLPLG